MERVKVVVDLVVKLVAGLIVKASAVLAIARQMTKTLIVNIAHSAKHEPFRLSV